VGGIPWFSMTGAAMAYIGSQLFQQYFNCVSWTPAARNRGPGCFTTGIGHPAEGILPTSAT
jgi:hypothetical protein